MDQSETKLILFNKFNYRPPLKNCNQTYHLFWNLNVRKNALLNIRTVLCKLMWNVEPRISIPSFLNVYRYEIECIFNL